jgi:hypothetical protein
MVGIVPCVDSRELWTYKVAALLQYELVSQPQRIFWTCVQLHQKVWGSITTPKRDPIQPNSKPFVSPMINRVTLNKAGNMHIRRYDMKCNAVPEHTLSLWVRRSSNLKSIGSAKTTWNPGTNPCTSTIGPAAKIAWDTCSWQVLLSVIRAASQL